MIMTEHMQSPVNYKSQELLASRYALPSRILTRNLGAYIDVSQYWPAFPGATEPEGNDIGRTVVPQVPIIELRDRHSSDKGY
jgi:hypothetical protein